LGDDILRLVGDPVPEVLRLLVGCADALPKLVACRLLQPALAAQQDMRLVARQGSLAHLLGQLAVHELDLVLADAPIPPGLHLRAFNHLLGESTVALFATPDRAAALREDFPRRIDGEAMLCPAADTSLRRSVDAWLEANGVRPRIVGEFDDTGLLKTFARAGFGVFAAPTIVADELAHAYGVVPIGTCSAIRERYYAITLEQRIRHPAVSAISGAARALLVG
ncbi:MAG: LysR family transcriptional regulator, partial [Deltaproteobacteria bacterium]|nr:LysR family transcriptional regulator [Deltaproteobacteria bacterium]